MFRSISSPWPKGNERGDNLLLLVSSGSSEWRTRAYFLRKFSASKLAIASGLSTLRKTYKTRRRRGGGSSTSEIYKRTQETRHPTRSDTKGDETRRGGRGRKKESRARSFLARFWGWWVANNATADIGLQLFPWEEDLAIARMSPSYRTFTALASVSNTRSRRKYLKYLQRHARVSLFKYCNKKKLFEIFT